MILLPPKRLLTPRSARQISPTNRGLLLGAPVPTQAGLTPAGLIQLSGRTAAAPYAIATHDAGQVPRILGAMVIITCIGIGLLTTGALAFAHRDLG